MATAAPAATTTEALPPAEDVAKTLRPEQADLVIEPIEGRPLWQTATWSQAQDEAVAILEDVLSEKR